MVQFFKKFNATVNCFPLVNVDVDIRNVVLTDLLVGL